jgi:cobyric acid synthase
MLHGLFENASIRGSLLGHLRGGDMAKPEALPNRPIREEEYDRLAATVRQHVDMDMLLRIAKI